MPHHPIHTTMCQSSIGPTIAMSFHMVSTLASYSSMCYPLVMPLGIPFSNLVYHTKTSKCDNIFIWHLFEPIKIVLEIYRWAIHNHTIFISIWNYQILSDLRAIWIILPHWKSFGPPKVWITQQIGEGTTPSPLWFQSPLLFLDSFLEDQFKGTPHHPNMKF